MLIPYTRSAHSNAYFYGFGSNKRIVIFDTLIEKGILPDEEKKDTSSATSTDEGQENLKEEEEEEKGGEGKEVENSEEKEKESTENEKKDNKKTGCNIEEILAVLCHELGHWYYSHTLKLIAINQVQIMRVVL